jgi:hypothetical protein
VRSLSASANARYDRLRLEARWARYFHFLKDGTRETITDTLSGGARLKLVPDKLTLEGEGTYNALTQEVLSARGALRYDVQCCGFMVEMTRFRLGGRSDNQINFQIQLANIGSVGSFGSEDASGPRGRGYAGVP